MELELRAKLLRLRQKAGGLLTDKQALLRLMIDSVSNFLVLARHALLVSGSTVGHQKREMRVKLAGHRGGSDAVRHPAGPARAKKEAPPRWMPMRCSRVT